MIHPTIQIHASGPAVIGVPFKKGALADAGNLSFVGADNAAIPTQARAFVKWEDGSVRWAIVSSLPPAPGAYQLISSKGNIANPVVVTRRANGITLSNGKLSAELCADGPGPIGKVTDAKGDVISAAGNLKFCVDDADTTREADRKLTILEEGPVRTRVRIEGAHFRHGGERRLSYRLDVELWAGASTLRLDYHFFHLEPGHKHLPISRLALDVSLAMTPSKTRRHFLQVHHGEFYEPRDVYNPAPVSLFVDNDRRSPRVEDAAMLLDTLEYEDYLDAPLADTAEWLGVTDDSRSVYVHLQDLTNMQPKRIASSDASLSVEFWPVRAGICQLPQGRSRRQVVTLGVAPGVLTAKQASALVSEPLWEGRATVDPKWLAECGAFEQAHVLPAGSSARFEKFIARTIALDFAAEMWDLGDTPDAGYTQSYTSLGLKKQPLLPGEKRPHRVFLTNSVLAPWCARDVYERVWVNNEYDGVHAIASELMRTGNPSHWSALRWMARHNIEVDFWHFRDEFWLHRISPVHSAKHATSGGYPSHFWTQGLLEYYCLTADPDALEVAIALGDAIIKFFHDPERGKFYKNFDRENGWALLALVHVFDITREPRFKAESERVIEFFMHGTQTNTSNTMRIESARGVVFNPGLVARFYFMLNLFEAMDLFQSVTGRKDIHDWLVESLAALPDVVIANFKSGSSAYSTCAALAIAFERTGDKRYLKAGLARIDELISDDPRWLNPVREIKPMAITYREFIRYLGHAQREGLLDAYEYQTVREWK